MEVEKRWADELVRNHSVPPPGPLFDRRDKEGK
jgi:hypothetical protein